MTKTWQFRQPALPRAFPGEKHEIARAFYVKYDQNYGLWEGPQLASAWAWKT